MDFSSLALGPDEKECRKERSWMGVSNTISAFSASPRGNKSPSRLPLVSSIRIKPRGDAEDVEDGRRWQLQKTGSGSFTAANTTC